MSRGAADVPNAWDDDDWVSQADKGASSVPPPALSRQERQQQHAEANRKLWESADSPETFHYIEASANTGGVPLSAASFKPQVKVLSRKPIAKRNPNNANAFDNNNDDDDDDAGRGGAQVLTPEEIRAKQKRERDEKQRRYDEARAKIFGESAPSSRGSSPGGTAAAAAAAGGTVTPPRSDVRCAPARGRGRGSGSGSGNGSGYNRGYNGGGGGSGNNSAGGQYFEGRRSGSARELYDPNSSPKPESTPRGRGVSSGDSSRVMSPRTEQQQQQQPQPQQQPAIRAPRGPDGSGRGGFSSRRGARET